MYCRNCGRDIDERAVYCPGCGVTNGRGDRFCQNCANPTDPKASVCVKCGVILSNSPGIWFSQNSGGKFNVNWIVCLLMSIFLGYFAIDRFMMGHVGLGILKIITCGGCGIWYVVDIILIAVRYDFKDVNWM
jgi:hypothetical protein